MKENNDLNEIIEFDKKMKNLSIILTKNENKAKALNNASLFNKLYDSPLHRFIKTKHIPYALALGGLGSLFIFPSFGAGLLSSLILLYMLQKIFQIIANAHTLFTTIMEIVASFFGMMGIFFILFLIAQWLLFGNAFWI